MQTNFDYGKFSGESKNLCKEYSSRSPYPFAIFDGLFSETLIDIVNQEIDESHFKKDERAIDGIEVKVRSDFEDNESLPPATKSVFEITNGGKFLNIVTQLTGIEGLISDPYYDGGGVNIIRNGGTLAVHVDGTTQHRMQLSRRLNAILFLNDHWDENWNGYHEQWEYLNQDLDPNDEKQIWRCVRKILPKKNRLLIFTTNDYSWHGHAGVLQVPEDVERRSLISYYYTSSRPGSDLRFENPHRAIFIKNKITLSDDAFQETEVIL